MESHVVSEPGLTEWVESILTPFSEDLRSRVDPRVVVKVWWNDGVPGIWLTPVVDDGRAYAIVKCGWDSMTATLSPPPWRPGVFVTRQWELCDPGCFEELEALMVDLALLVPAEQGGAGG